MKVFFIGICGISMSALAAMLKNEGLEVRGSDLNLTNIPKCLDGIEVFPQPYTQGVKWADVIVCSSAIKENAELEMAKSLHKKILSRGELLGEISREYEKVIAVAGSHGKTTTTAMIFHILYVNGKNPTLHLGGHLKDIGNVQLGGKEFFVTEACEYCDNFLYLHPYISVITNIEPEHLDYFKTFENELESFEKFRKNSEIVIENPAYTAKRIKIIDGKVKFDLYKGQTKIDEISLKIGGEYNAYNAVYAISVCEKLGLSLPNIKFGLETFKGVLKRCEKVKTSFDFDVYVDYAHHPKEILESAKYFKKICKKRCVAVFQPHTYSRTKKFYDDFIKSLEIFDEVICFKTYAAREKPEEGLNETDLAKGLQASGKIAYICESESDLRKLLKRYKKGDLIVFLGAGDLPDKFDFLLPLT